MYDFNSSSRFVYGEHGKMSIDWPIESIHPDYGKCVMMGVIDGEKIRWFDKDGVISMIPLDACGEYED